MPAKRFEESCWGSIVVFHDSEKAYEKLLFTLPKVLTFFRGRVIVLKD
jgi:hypothetical protein